MATKTAIGIGLIVFLAAFEAYILWRYPDFRRAFIEHWHPSAVAKRMDDFAKRLDKVERRS